MCGCYVLFIIKAIPFAYLPTCIAKMVREASNFLFQHFLKSVHSLSRSMQSSSEAKDGTPKKPKQCNCKHSRCLKL